MSVSTPPDGAGITLDQVYDALRALGAGVPRPEQEAVPMSRAQALGLLLFLTEGALIAENDPIGREATQAGYVGGIISSVRLVARPGVDAAYQEAWTRLLDERLSRLVVDVRTSCQAHPKEFPAGPAADALLSAAIVLVQTLYPPPPGSGGCEKQLLDALRQARAFMVTARGHIEALRRKLKEAGRKF